jgi:hypothetical protein
VTAGWPAGVTMASNTAARLAVRFVGRHLGPQVHQQPVEPVDGLGADGHQVLAPLGQQVQHHRLILDADLPQGGRAAGRDRN